MLVDLDLTPVAIQAAGRINVLMGKNGSGKSTLLRQLRRSLPSERVKYITPERGGAMKYEPGMDHQIRENRNHYLGEERAKNQKTDFRSQSAALFNELLSNFMQSVHDKPQLRSNANFTFESIVLSKINALLDNLEIRRGGGARIFIVTSRDTGEEVGPEQMSSGESELFSLAVEVLAFAFEDGGLPGIILFDEPDVHLHPDLQHRLVVLLDQISREYKVQFVIATHSTAFIAALSDVPDARVAFLRKGVTRITFQPLSNALRDIVPVFSPHPLSNQFNARPLLIVEGEDDALAWAQASKSSNGRIKVSPCVAGTISKMAEYERTAEELAATLYDNPLGFSIRDGDNGNGINTNLKVIKSFVLNCYSLENLLLADDVLASNSLDWETMRGRIQTWLDSYPEHQMSANVRAFIDGGFDRRSHRIKDYRNIFLGIINPNRPFYMVVGQSIARLRENDLQDVNKDGALANFLGKPLLEGLLFRPA
jgi:ABC-type multidrug transport system ATPase subunit